MFNKFVPPPASTNIQETAPQGQDEGGGTNLADLILEKIAAHEAMQTKSTIAPVEEVGGDDAQLHPKVIQVYTT